MDDIHLKCNQHQTQHSIKKNECLKKSAHLSDIHECKKCNISPADDSNQNSCIPWYYLVFSEWKMTKSVVLLQRWGIFHPAYRAYETIIYDRSFRKLSESKEKSNKFDTSNNERANLPRDYWGTARSSHTPAGCCLFVYWMVYVLSFDLPSLEETALYVWQKS